MKGTIWLLFVVGCVGNGHETPTPDAACSGLGESDCAHASGCHSLFTSEEPCDNVCCGAHFEACADGATADCIGGHPSGACNVSCTQTSSVCSGSLVQSYSDDGCCPDGCVAISQCDGVTSTPSSQCPSGREDTVGSDSGCDPGDLSQFGVQGCPI
jgi:hypothetical protein